MQYISRDNHLSDEELQRIWDEESKGDFEAVGSSNNGKKIDYTAPIDEVKMKHDIQHIVKVLLSAEDM